MVTFRLSSWRPLWPVILVLFLMVRTWPARADIDNFDDSDDQGWTHYNPINTGSWTFPNRAYRIQSAVSPIPSQLGPGRAGSQRTIESYSAFYVAVDLVTWDNLLNEVFGLSARVSDPGPGTTKGYAFVYNTRGGAGSGQVGLIRITSEDVSALAAVNLPLLPNQTYRFIFSGALGQLNGQVFAVTNLSVPLATVSATDGTYASGSVGLFTYANASGNLGTADVTFDNFEFKELTPQLIIEKDSASSDVRLSWPDWAAAYRLERSDALPITGWDDLGNQFPNIDGRIIAFDDTSRAQAFYRLTKP